LDRPHARRKPRPPEIGPEEEEPQGKPDSDDPDVALTTAAHVENGLRAEIKRLTATPRARHGPKMPNAPHNIRVRL